MNIVIAYGPNEDNRVGNQDIFCEEPIDTREHTNGRMLIMGGKKFIGKRGCNWAV